MGDFSSGAWRDHVRAATETTRAMTAAKATRISPSAMSEVLAALHDYWGALEACDLKDKSKAIYMSMADNFVRWMRDEFVPGSRSSVSGYVPRRFKELNTSTSSSVAVDACRCGHSAENHIFPGTTQYADCHLCACELYNPPGGIKGLAIHPLYAFTEDEYRMVSCQRCGQFSVLPEGVCERCGWDSDKNGPVERTRPRYCHHSPNKHHESSLPESSRCRYCLCAIETTPGTHGTQERWEAGCDCNDCRYAIRHLISSSSLPSALSALLRDLLIFRRNRNELWLTSSTLNNEVKRQHLDRLIQLGILTKSSDDKTPGLYLLWLERLKNLH